MVAKISHGASLYGALSYNHEKVFQGTAEILSGHAFTEHWSITMKRYFRGRRKSCPDTG